MEIIIRMEENKEDYENFAKYCKEKVDNHWISFCLPYIQEAVQRNEYSCRIAGVYACPYTEDFNKAFPTITHFLRDLGFTVSTSNSYQDLFISWN